MTVEQVKIALKWFTLSILLSILAWEILAVFYFPGMWTISRWAEDANNAHRWIAYSITFATGGLFGHFWLPQWRTHPAVLAAVKRAISLLTMARVNGMADAREALVVLKAVEGIR